ncbi:uncharacterized protein [Choristoneura fumiferana]|uniref:uncharacterized protein n=1 Tax=Choristoneura fumiferana TaxID=7141 RepID=UPI003D15DEE7
MSQLFLCRVCLASDVTVYNILNSYLQEIYEKLTQIPFHPDDGKPHTVCCMCVHLLRSSYQLWVKSMTADRLLSCLLTRGDELSRNSIKQIDRQEHKLAVSLSVSKQVEVHIEPTVTEVKDEVLVKRESDDLKEEFTGFSSDNESRASVKEPEVQSDSEDDIPLQAISAQNKLRTVNKNSDKEFLKGFKSGYARELLLTKEQQLQELTDRASSANYMNAPFKCELCCRGYVDATAFDNHKEKHDVPRVPVCSMRYKTARKLRAHAVTAHERRYQCNACAHRSHTASQAREHEKWHRGHLYSCRLCGHQSRKSTSHLTHMRARHRTPHVCARCGRSFVGAHGLRMHASKAHRGEQPIETSPPEDRYCADCDIQFLSLVAWKRHILSSVNHAFGKGNNGVCVICGPACPGGGRHLKESLKALKPAAKTAVARPNTLTCEQCGSSFTNGSKLQAHVKRVHLGVKYNKNVVCEVCGKKCTSNASLKYHQRTHTGEKPYQCASCPKRFADSNQLRIHTRRHTGERPYCCRHCRRTFTQKPALNRHYRVHTGAKPYSCQYCAKNFSQSNSLKLHIRTVHLKIPNNKKRGPDSEKKEDIVEKLE